VPQNISNRRARSRASFLRPRCGEALGAYRPLLFEPLGSRRGGGALLPM
jgi:hypothetical protein